MELLSLIIIIIIMTDVDKTVYNIILVSVTTAEYDYIASLKFKSKAHRHSGTLNIKHHSTCWVVNRHLRIDVIPDDV